MQQEKQLEGDGRGWRISAVMLQTRRQSASRAPETLVRALERLHCVDYHLVVVDVGDPGEWVHRLSERLVHAGAGSDRGRMAALDRGIGVVEQLGIETDVWLLTCDVLLDDAEGAIDQIGDAVVELAVERSAAIGPLYDLGGTCRLQDLEYDCWLDTGLMLIPKAVVGVARPFDTGLEADAVLLGELEEPGATPFREDAPLSAELQTFLLDRLTTSHRSDDPVVEAAPTAFALDTSTLGRFTAEAMEMLAEHLVSARLVEAGVAGYDLGLASRLARDAALERCFEADSGSWTWIDSVRYPERIEPRFHVETARIPEVMIHGDASRVEISGWILAVPPVERVVIRASEHLRFEVPCMYPRPDVLEAYPQFVELSCGFELVTDLAELAPGRHELRLEVPELAISEVVSEVTVEPRLDFKVHGAELEGFVANDCSLRVALDGEIRSSVPLDQVEVGWDIRSGDVPASLVVTGEPRNALHRYRLRACGVVGTWRIRFTDAEGSIYTWHRDIGAMTEGGMLQTQVEPQVPAGDRPAGETPEDDI